MPEQVFIFEESQQSIESVLAYFKLTSNGCGEVPGELMKAVNELNEAMKAFGIENLSTFRAELKNRDGIKVFIDLSEKGGIDTRQILDEYNKLKLIINLEKRLVVLCSCQKPTPKKKKRNNDILAIVRQSKQIEMDGKKIKLEEIDRGSRFESEKMKPLYKFFNELTRDRLSSLVFYEYYLQRPLEQCLTISSKWRGIIKEATGVDPSTADLALVHTLGVNSAAHFCDFTCKERPGDQSNAACANGGCSHVTNLINAEMLFLKNPAKDKGGRIHCVMPEDEIKINARDGETDSPGARAPTPSRFKRASSPSVFERASTPIQSASPIGIRESPSAPARAASPCVFERAPTPSQPASPIGIRSSPGSPIRVASPCVFRSSVGRPQSPSAPARASSPCISETTPDWSPLGECHGEETQIPNAHLLPGVQISARHEQKGHVCSEINKIAFGVAKIIRDVFINERIIKDRNQHGTLVVNAGINMFEIKKHNSIDFTTILLTCNGTMEDEKANTILNDIKLKLDEKLHNIGILLVKKEEVPLAPHALMLGRKVSFHCEAIWAILCMLLLQKQHKPAITCMPVSSARIERELALLSPF